MATKPSSSADVQRPSAASICSAFDKTAKANKPSEVFSHFLQRGGYSKRLPRLGMSKSSFMAKEVQSKTFRVTCIPT
ncbi:MAG TPA: hypothetical protein VI278_02640 [Nitrososphaeraceae archaeon]